MHRSAFAALALAAACSMTPAPIDAPVENGGIVVTSDTWRLTGFAIDSAESGPFGMPDVVRLDDGSLRLYYFQSSAASASSIMIADSPDGATWTPRAQPALAAATADTRSRPYVVSGPSVVKLPDGRYRMFTHASKVAGDGVMGDDHIRSAISSDGGLTFTDEGVVIDNQSGDPSSPWVGVGHGRVYALEDGSWAGIFSVVRTAGAAPDLALFTSPDALHFTYARTLYVGWHDPVVVKRNGQYLMVAQYLTDHFTAVVSPDGVTWYPEVAQVDLTDPSGLAGSAGASGASDFGAVVDARGQVLLFCNLRGTIAMFESADQ
jgi:hypothetical protein